MASACAVHVGRAVGGRRRLAYAFHVSGRKLHGPEAPARDRGGQAAGADSPTSPTAATTPSQGRPGQLAAAALYMATSNFAVDHRPVRRRVRAERAGPIQCGTEGRRQARSCPRPRRRNAALSGAPFAPTAPRPRGQDRTPVLPPAQRSPRQQTVEYHVKPVDCRVDDLGTIYRWGCGQPAPHEAVRAWARCHSRRCSLVPATKVWRIPVRPLENQSRARRLQGVVDHPAGGRLRRAIESTRFRSCPYPAR